ncbi:D-sedoheptulose 7-phosphate isomerase [Carboxylicivirga linearis]|uniref:Phosphoheptose isomerase n=1 Tax=Carboxylicivirga linearis TaxID=1628157 RepID=A0ABS5JP78_9BACT|nr:D-sedoheptulose 7-phosphate isomerase [Carboxylicivirga linearis]MBS2096690.1 D-sedoheptulose 7-phosphate isomerase [Carboxylicivirga linearis]
MTREDIAKSFIEAQEVLNRFIEDAENWDRIKKAGDLMVEAVNSDKKIFSCGNGGSMSDAMHFAEELTGLFRDERRGMPAIAISDPTHITCVGNDYGFDFIFSRYVEAVGCEGDVLLAISTSGNSSNVLNAAKVAKEKGMKVVALTGKKGGELAQICDVEIRAPHNGYSDRIQEIHIKVIHVLIQYIEGVVNN